MADKLLNYLHYGTVTAVTRKIMIGSPPVEGEASLPGPTACSDSDDTTYVEDSWNPTVLASRPLTFYITSFHKWYPTYIRFLYYLNSGSIAVNSLSLYKGSTELSSQSVTLTSGTHDLILRLDYNGASYYHSEIGSAYKIVLSNHISSGQTLLIYTLELGEYKFTSLLAEQIGSSSYTPRLGSQTHNVSFLAGSATETDEAQHPLRLRRSPVTVSPLNVFTVPDDHYSTVYNQGYTYHLFKGVSLKHRYVPAKNFFFNSGCASTTLYPNLTSASYTLPTPTNCTITLTNSVFRVTKGSTPATDAICYLGTNSTTDFQSLSELSNMTLYLHKIVLALSGRITTGTAASVVYEEYSAGSWSEIARIDLTAIDPNPFEHQTVSGDTTLMVATGVRCYLLIPAAQPAGTVVELDDLFLGVL